MSDDIKTLRELAKKYMEKALDPKQERRRELWRHHNSLKMTRPPIYARAWGWIEMPESKLTCADPFFREFEDFFRRSLFRDTFDDDYVLEPWVTLDAVKVLPNSELWGVSAPWKGRAHKTAGVCEAAIKEPEDLAKLIKPSHRIDEEKTAAALTRLQDAVGDIIAIDLDRGPAYRMWNGDISTRLADLRGLEQILWDMVDRPEWLHRLLSFMRDGILDAQRQAEEAGDWTLSRHQNQAVPYCEELAPPIANGRSVKRKELWYFCASQETTVVGPDMFREFMLDYQIPILREFGLVAYGCCEDLSRKIPLLRKIPNLRRVAVSPMANVKACAEQIGDDYVISYRPSPADMVSYGYNPDRIRAILRRDFDILKGRCFDITLKDVETVENDPHRVRDWTRLTREVIAEFYD